MGYLHRKFELEMEIECDRLTIRDMTDDQVSAVDRGNGLRTARGVRRIEGDRSNPARSRRDGHLGLIEAVG